jgi:acetyl esterase
MPIYDAKSIPAEVNSSTKDPEVAAFLKTGPVLGAHKPIHVQRVEHNAFIDRVKPPIGKIEHLVLDGPHGSLPVRVYYPSKPGPAQGGALIYVHGGGFIVGTLDQFDTAMRLFSEISGAQVYSVDYKLAPEYQWPTQIEETEFVVRWLFEHASERGLDPSRIGLGGDSAGGNMTCTVSLKLRDENGPKLALQMPIYPEAEMPFFHSRGRRKRVRRLCRYSGRSAFCVVPRAAGRRLLATVHHAHEREEPCWASESDSGDGWIRYASRCRTQVRSEIG